MEKKELDGFVQFRLPFPNDKTLDYTGKEGFIRFYSFFYKPLYREFFRHCKETAEMDADALCQDVFLKILVRQSRGLDETIIAATAPQYLNYVANSIIKNYWSRSDKALKEREADLVDEESNSDPTVVYSYEAISSETLAMMDPATIHNHRNRYEYIKQKLKSFNSTDQFIIKEAFERDVPLKQVAKWLDMSYATIRKRTQRIRDKSRVALEDFYKEGE